MARYQIILSYDGTEFHGFQRQGQERTVQLEVENALRRMGWEGRSILASGRTDCGVHGGGQVITFDLTWGHPVETLLKALNAHLPQDIGARSAKEVDPSFHPRFDALRRTYRYQLYFQPFRDPLQERFAWRVWPKPDLKLAENSAELLLGQHDFQAFGSPMKPGGSTIRLVTGSEWTQTPNGWVYEITANAFLYHMVRRIVYLQVMVAMQKMDLAELEQCIVHAAPGYPGMAPANGLVLAAVQYADVCTDEERNYLENRNDNKVL